MVDTLPTFDEDYGSEGDGNSSAGGSPEGEDSNGSSDGVWDNGSVASAGERQNPEAGQSGTRADAEMESDMGTNGPLTAAEQVAILDRQLEESTRVFDGIIYDEEQRQRDATRDRTTQKANWEAQ